MHLDSNPQKRSQDLGPRQKSGKKPADNFGLPPSPLFIAYGQHLEEKIARNEIGRDGASNYARAIKRFQKWVESASQHYNNATDLELERHILGKEEAGELLHGYLISLDKLGASAQARNANRSVLFQFYKWANENNLTEFHPAEAGYLAPQLANVKRPAVVLDWAAHLRETSSSSSFANQTTMGLSGFVEYLACTLYPPSGQDMDLKGEWRALKNIESANEPVAAIAVRARNKTFKTVTANLLLKASEWVPNYLTALENKGVSPDQMKRIVYSMRRFYEWAHAKGLTPIAADSISNPYVAHPRRSHRRTKLSEGSEEKKQGKIPRHKPIPVSKDKSQLEDSSTITTKPQRRDTANSIVHSERAKVENIDNIVTMLLRDTDLSFSQVRGLRAASFSVALQAIQVGDKFVEVKSIFEPLCRALCVVHEIRRLTSFSDFPDSSESLVCGKMSDVLRDEELNTVDKNAKAYMKLRDQIVSALIKDNSITFRQVCEISYPSVKRLPGTYRIEIEEGFPISTNGNLSPKISEYIQMGRIYLPGAPFQNSTNPVHFILTIDGEPLSNVFD